MSISTTRLTLASASLSALLLACATPTAAGGANDPAGAELVAAHLAKFDDLDYQVFSHQEWARLHESHAQNIKVHWPDGHVTEGIDVHLADLKAMFVWAPDTRIEEHPVKLGQGDWTAVIGVMQGTFSQPMPTPSGATVPPTGKAYKITMATIGHWKDGVMDEEFLFWDNQDFYRQIGLGQ